MCGRDFSDLELLTGMCEYEACCPFDCHDCPMGAMSDEDIESELMKRGFEVDPAE
jgi:hypothetical protein